MENTNGAVKYALIVTVVNLGFAEDVISAANSISPCAGAVVHARRAGLDKDKSFFGISIETEKEIVTILTRVEEKTEIMQAIGKACGIATNAHGIIFSLPADDVMLPGENI